MKHIAIVGAGPRGLACALHALYKGHEVTLIDPNPLHTWTSQYMISNLEMRSPVTFDLVTYVKELHHYSLARYLGIDSPFTLNQSVIEASPFKVSRYDFCNYVNYIYDSVLSYITLINQKVIDVTGNIVTLENSSSINFDAVIFCLGYQGKTNTPHCLRSLEDYTQANLPTILKNPQDYSNKNVLVVGSGQGAAEVVEYLTRLNNFVFWTVSKSPKVYQYPSPDYKLWGSKSGLGSYYTTLNRYSSRLQYLSKIKAWQPSITPYIASKLSLVKDAYHQVILSSFNTLDILPIDYVVLMAGVSPSINAIPSKEFIPLNSYLPNFPEILSNFRVNIPSCNWYVSGILATAYDGPRQNSLISAGLTAKTIIEDIENGSA